MSSVQIQRGHKITDIIIYTTIGSWTGRQMSPPVNSSIIIYNATPNAG